MKRSTVILVLIALALAAGVIAFESVREKQQELATEERLLLKFEPAVVDQITIERTPSETAESPEMETIHIERLDPESSEAADSDSTWQITEPVTALGDDVTIGALLQSANRLDPQDPLEDVTDVSEFGLDPAAETLTLTLDDGTTHTLKLGTLDFQGTSLYLQVDDNPIFTIPSGQRGSLAPSLFALRNKTLLAVDPSMLESIELIRRQANQEEAETLDTEATPEPLETLDPSESSESSETPEASETPTSPGSAETSTPAAPETPEPTTSPTADDSITTLRLEQTGSGWDMTEPASVKVDPIAVARLTGRFSNLQAASFVAETQADLAEYGLDQPDIEITLNVASETSDEPITLALARDEEAGQVYVITSESPTIATIATSTAEAFEITPNDLRDKQLAEFDPDAIQEVRIEAANPSLSRILLPSSVSVEPTPESSPSPDASPAPAPDLGRRWEISDQPDRTVILDSFFTTIEALEATDFVPAEDPTATAALNDPIFSVTLIEEAAEGSEPEEIEITFAQTGENVYVRSSFQPDLAIVDLLAFDDLQSAVETLRPLSGAPSTPTTEPSPAETEGSEETVESPDPTETEGSDEAAETPDPTEAEGLDETAETPDPTETEASDETTETPDPGETQESDEVEATPDPSETEASDDVEESPDPTVTATPEPADSEASQETPSAESAATPEVEDSNEAEEATTELGSPATPEIEATETDPDPASTPEVEDNDE